MHSPAKVGLAASLEALLPAPMQPKITRGGHEIRPQAGPSMTMLLFMPGHFHLTSPSLRLRKFAHQGQQHPALCPADGDRSNNQAC